LFVVIRGRIEGGEEKRIEGEKEKRGSRERMKEE